jgi:hypothetical protein
LNQVHRERQSICLHNASTYVIVNGEKEMLLLRLDGTFHSLIAPNDENNPVGFVNLPEMSAKRSEIGEYRREPTKHKEH